MSIEAKTITETIEISSADAPSRAQKIVEKNDIIFETTRPTQKRYCLICDQYAGEIASTGYCVLRANQNEVLPKWILHWIGSSDFNKYVEENQSGSAYPAISDSKVKDFKIPIPCPENPEKSLAIQAEIVRILDAMTSHTAELTAELTLRKKQYNYYRDKLLSFEDGEVEWKTLGEVCDFKNGFSFKSSLFKESGLPIIRITNVDGKNISLEDVKYFDPSDYKENTASYEISKGDILIAMSGATTGKIGFYAHESPAYLNQRVGKFLPKPKILNNRYLYHYLLSKVEQIYVIAGGGAQPNLSSNALIA